MTISTSRLCQRWSFRKTRACWLGSTGMGCETRGQASEFAVRDHFLDHDFEHGMFSTCVFAHRSKLLLYFVHGDDFVGLGVRGDLEGYRATLSELFIIKDRGILGADGLHEMQILNRVITIIQRSQGVW